MTQVSDDLINWLASVSSDPLAFVYGAFPWGEPSTRLEHEHGPEPWQVDLLCAVRDGLIDLASAIQYAIASGHGVGKTALVCWLILWAISTLADTRGVVTANTEAQLKTKTWAELGKWYHLFIAKDHFTLTATALFSSDTAHERTWRIDMVPWSERNTEAFAGLHNKGRRILVIFDEASAIPDVIWETTEGALTDADTQIIWCVFGNPTRNSGRFRECFAGQRFANVWKNKQVDSRTVSFTNKAQIAKWEESYGEDSDFFRIRVRGVFPRVGELEFFSVQDVDDAMSRDVETDKQAPLALGVDVARYGGNYSVIWPRKGRDARSIERQRFQGLGTDQLADKVAETHHQLHSDGIFIDGTGVGGGVVDNVRRSQLFCYEVQFGARDDTPHVVFGSSGERYANKRSGIYGAGRAWLKTAALPNDPAIRAQFLAIKYIFNKKDEIQLISKDDIIADARKAGNLDFGLDDIDALMCTFAHALQRHEHAGGDFPQKPLVESEYDPYSPERMVA